MKTLKDYIINEATTINDWWSSDEFDDRETNYYDISWVHKYESLAGPTEQKYHYYLAIWDKESLTDKELEKAMSEWCHVEKKDESTLNKDYNEVKHDTLANIMKKMNDNTEKSCWVDFVDLDAKVCRWWADKC